MAYDEHLAARIRKALGPRKDVTEKHMFGGVAFMLKSGMFCGIVKNDLMVRVGPEQHDLALSRPHARVMDFTGRPMRGFIFVAPAGFKTDSALKTWLDMGETFVATLTGKKAKAKRGRRTG